MRRAHNGWLAYPTYRAALALAGALAIAASLTSAAGPTRARAVSRAVTTIKVPENYRTIQAAINAASPGDVIDIAAGTYGQNLTVDVGITLRGRSYSRADPRTNTTILDGGGKDVVTVPEGVRPAPSFVGLVIAHGDNGLITRSPSRVAHSYFVGNAYDSLEYDLGGGGVALNNVIASSGDDGIDIDHAVRNVRLERNRVLRSGDDGVEIRLHDDVLPDRVEILVVESEIIGSREDGIQLIDYYDDTNRRIVVRGNLIRDTAMAALGMMDHAETNEDFRAASIREPVHVFHNTFVNNDHGISGGDNLIALNNIFQGHALALKNVDGKSVASYNLFWNNAVNVRKSTFERNTSVFARPRLGPAFHLRAGSPAIDAGTAHFKWHGEIVMDQPRAQYEGTAPDIGWFERRQERTTSLVLQPARVPERSE